MLKIIENPRWRKNNKSKIYMVHTKIGDKDIEIGLRNKYGINVLYKERLSPIIIESSSFSENTNLESLVCFLDKKKIPFKLV